ncbi:Uu.00g106310.m01.CDS01 [Anthostomella pinea]|uniref:Uu.00g106310.m01.CDS01 n=1 Tax=Anthostomella pinea TaxID=933095 RepID=A0AAI8YFV7_9PEZI|nr:Uu.00g106310.m01.CDS01 [Anthostomella pinea]
MAVVLGMHVHSPVLLSAALLYYGVFGTLGDVVILAACYFWKRGSHGLHLLSSNVQTLISVLGITAVAFAIVSYSGRGKKSDNASAWKGPGRPLLFPCHTAHTRLFPKKHSFSYSYLLVGIPVGWSGVAGDMISAGGNGQGGKGWYRVDAADYLERGNGHLGLRGKLDAYLKSQGADVPKYPHAYLVTAAKFLGYHFNPASFWYLYSADKHLTAVIVEVNNTFDERRLYFLTPNDQADGQIEGINDENAAADAIPSSNANASKPLRQSWAKDFHVSPFNSRKGGYSLIAHDPLASDMTGRGPINTTINLKSSKDHVKLVARVFSKGEALDPTGMSVLEKVQFLTSWWWVGFVTFPRIAKEAASLFFQRKLHVWYRPEPLKESMGRRADATERQLEPIFRRYLRHLVEQSSAPLALRYIPSGVADARPEDMLSAAAEKGLDFAEHLEFKVLTPAFYSRFVCYAHDLEALFCEMNENCTVWVSNPKSLPKLVFKKPPPPLQIANYLDYGYFSAIKNLRQRPERIERPVTSSQPTTTSAQKDIRGFRLSSMDGYVLSNEDDETRQLYRHLILRLFVADRIAFGSVDVLWVEGLLLRILLAWVALP